MAVQYECKNCNSESVRQLPSIFDEGSWKSSTKTRSTGSVSGLTFHGGQIGTVSASSETVSVSHSSGQTNLARKLAPPVGPKPVGNAWLYLGSVLTLFAYWSSDSVVGCIISASGAVLCFSLDLVTRKDRRQKLEVLTENWRSMMDLWRRSVYCGRCGFLTDPVSGLTGVADSLAGYLQTSAQPRISPVPRVRIVPILVVLTIVPSTCGLSLHEVHALDKAERVRDAQVAIDEQRAKIRAIARMKKAPAKGKKMVRSQAAATH